MLEEVEQVSKSPSPAAHIDPLGVGGPPAVTGAGWSSSIFHTRREPSRACTT